MSNRISSAFAASGQPFQSPLHLDFLQDATKEMVAQHIIGMIGEGYDTGTVYRLYGADLTNTAGDFYSNTSGAVFLGGEVFVVDAVGGGGTNFSEGIDMEVYTTTSDTTNFADSSTHGINQVRKMRYVNNASPVFGQPEDIFYPYAIEKGGLTMNYPETLTFKTNQKRVYTSGHAGSEDLEFTLDVSGAKIGASVTMVLGVDGGTQVFTEDENIIINEQGSWAGGLTIQYMRITYLGNGGPYHFVNVQYINS